MKKWMNAVCVLMLVLSVTGCSPAFDPSITSMYVQKDGKVTYAVVESFEKEYYSLDEFQDMIEKEVEISNSNYSEPAISVERLEVKDDTLYLLMEFANAEAYEGYSEEYCFIGSVSDALDEGRAFNMTFKDADYKEYTTAEVTAKKENQVLVLQKEGVVELEGTIKYVSNNVEVLSEHMVQIMPIEDKEEYAYIIY